VSCCLWLQACLDNYKQQLVGDPIIHTHLTALYGEWMSPLWACRQALGGMCAHSQQACRCTRFI
jgi:hypothetical protein